MMRGVRGQFGGVSIGIWQLVNLKVIHGIHLRHCHRLCWCITPVPDPEHPNALLLNPPRGYSKPTLHCLKTTQMPIISYML